MEAVRVLLEQYWIDKKRQKELYTKVRRELPACQRFFREQLGWSVIHNEQVLKIEKIPARAAAFMGITDFTEIRDYCLFCGVLIFLEDREEQERFLLSELVDMLEVQLKGVMEVDWTLFTQRRSLVRVLQFCEKRGLIELCEEQREDSSLGREVLYENTGLSRYMTVNFTYGISTFSSWQDFEQEQNSESGADRGHYRINRVYRQLAAAPALYWKQTDDQDSIYLKNQRQWVQKNLRTYLDGQLQIHKNAAFLVMEEQVFGERHPREAMLPELILCFCGRIRELVETGVWTRRPDDCIAVKREDFLKELYDCREKYQEAWGKEYREMEPEKLAGAVIAYMKSWMMLSEEKAGNFLIWPAAGKVTGRYPADFQIEERED